MQDWALDHIRDIAFDCVNAIESLTENSNGANNTNTTFGIDIKNTLANTCVDICVHGSCTNGKCSWLFELSCRNLPVKL